MKTTKEILKWLKSNCGARCTAALTSTDTYALTAAVAICPLISYQGADPDLFNAFRNVVMAMQQHTRWLAYHAIAMELDWGHREMIWTAADLDDLDKPAGLASFEPGGPRVDKSKMK